MEPRMADVTLYCTHMESGIVPYCTHMEPGMVDVNLLYPYGTKNGWYT